MILLSMRRALLWLPLAVLVLTGPPAGANDAFLASFRDYLEALRVQTNIPGLSGAIIGRDEILWMQGLGRQDLDRNIAATVDTPYHLDGVSQVFTSTLFLRCTELGILSLETPIGQWVAGVPEPQTTIAQALTHTTGPAGDPLFTFNPDRLLPLTTVYRRGCLGDSFRETLGMQFELLGMGDSVPGPDVTRLVPPAEGIPTPSQVDRYTLVLNRLATPYTYNAAQRHHVTSVHAATTLTPAAGMITTVRDYAKFDLALKRGELLQSSTLAAAWQPPMARAGIRLPHGVGWFVQTHNGEPIVWQFGVSDSGSSSMVMMAPNRGLTLVLLANSPGLVRPFALDKGDLVASPFGGLFLGMLVR